MNETVSKNIRKLRDARAWTQEQLAMASQLNVRTVQRAEEGRGTSAETLTAIAGAFDVSVDALREDPWETLGRLLGLPAGESSPASVSEALEAAKQRYTVLPLTTVDSERSLEVIRDADAFRFDRDVDGSQALDVAAELEMYLGDLLNVVNELSPVQLREELKSVWAIVQRLVRLGVHVAAGVHTLNVSVADGGKMRLATLYVLASRADNPKSAVMIEKGQALRFR